MDRLGDQVKMEDSCSSYTNDCKIVNPSVWYPIALITFNSTEASVREYTNFLLWDNMRSMFRLVDGYLNE